MDEMDGLVGTNEKPDWLPGRVVMAAERLIKRGGSDQLSSPAIVAAVSLALDRRMEMVWRVIFQKSSNSSFMYPARPAALNRYSPFLRSLENRIAFLGRLDDQRSKAELATMLTLKKSYVEHEKTEGDRIRELTVLERQLRASVSLYGYTFGASQGAGTMTPSRVEETLRYLREKKETLRELSEVGLSTDLSEAECELNQFEFFVQQVKISPFYVMRESGDGDLRGFVIALELRMKELFGARLSGVIATLANVSFDRSDVTDKKVRELTRSNNKRIFTKHHI